MLCVVAIMAAEPTLVVCVVWLPLGHCMCVMFCCVTTCQCLDGITSVLMTLSDVAAMRTTQLGVCIVWLIWWQHCLLCGCRAGIIAFVVLFGCHTACMAVHAPYGGTCTTALIICQGSLQLSMSILIVCTTCVCNDNNAVWVY